ncbi:hypothetical protein BDQ12DRAFT_684637 [Crucibulum laeve]|uniref:Uncharacterized protein n=1 Tax=Crucibulum laeve TaxID=68775 RepID=A0A5C3LX91_9AGAR|nr:hypothetical protein BDQ12DRAFT_684637 [Crucibulum laeve]
MTTASRKMNKPTFDERPISSNIHSSKDVEIEDERRYRGCIVCCVFDLDLKPFGFRLITNIDGLRTRMYPRLPMPVATAIANVCSPQFVLNQPSSVSSSSVASQRPSTSISLVFCGQSHSKDQGITVGKPTNNPAWDGAHKPSNIEGRLPLWRESIEHGVEYNA